MRVPLLLAVFVALVCAAAAAQNWTNLDDNLSGWQSCGTPQCSGGKGTAHYSGPVADRYPSLDGQSARFSFITPTSGYSNALYWYNTICCVTDISASYTQFTYALYYYVKNPKFIQALEFDVNQTISDPATNSSVRYVFGHECNLQDTGTWRVWDEASGWVNTGYPCNMPANSWIYLKLTQMRDTSSGRVYYSAIQVNNTIYTINYYGKPRKLGVLADDLNVAFQMDSDKLGDAYSVWLDRVSLSAR